MTYSFHQIPKEDSNKALLFRQASDKVHPSQAVQRVSRSFLAGARGEPPSPPTLAFAPWPERRRRRRSHSPLPARFLPP